VEECKGRRRSFGFAQDDSFAGVRDRSLRELSASQLANPGAKKETDAGSI
jgi:hypothetical protein